MISMRLAVPAVLFAAAVAGCFTYFVRPLPLVTVAPQLPEKMPELSAGIPTNIDRPKAQEKADDFLQAAQAILKQEPNAQASVDKPIVTGHIPYAEEAADPALSPTRLGQLSRWAYRTSSMALFRSSAQSFARM
jgi:hypothetical protein